jgi:putative ABC transport system permease protein
MTFDETMRIAVSNLWRTKLRTFLTTLGVVIGIGALVSMMSFGTGMQKNITEMFEKNDLFTSMQVLRQKIDVAEAMQAGPEGLAGLMKPSDALKPALDDSALEKIRLIGGVALAYPEISFPVKIRFRGQEIKTQVRGLPADMARYKPYSEIPYGRFFNNDTENSLIVNPPLLRKLKIVLVEPGKSTRMSAEDTLRGMVSLRPDSLLGREVEVISSVVDVPSLMQNPFAAMSFGGGVPLKERITRLRIAGIARIQSDMNGPYRDRGIYVPLKTAQSMPHMGFTSIWELVGKDTEEKGYPSLYVRVKKVTALDTVKKQIETMGFGTLAIADQLQEFKKGFLIFDMALGAVGTIALVVAALGIINTMVMSILERTREIGIMKAIGGSENEIRGIFFIEAGAIGLLGGVFGLALGWVVTRVANMIANIYIARQGGPHIDYFYIPPWLILGAVAFSILVSLLAGMYPAARAARVNPVEALRHD